MTTRGQPQSTAPVHKVIMVGAGGVGKSACTLQFMYDEFVEDYEPTKADSYSKKVTIDNEEVRIDILDTAGEEDYLSVRDSYFRSGEGFLAMFSIADNDTFNIVADIREHILRIKGGDDASGGANTSVPMILVGNKADLAERRQVLQADAEARARSWGVKYIESSAKTRVNVEQMFFDIMREIRAKKLEQQAKQAASAPNPKASKKKKRKCHLL